MYKCENPECKEDVKVYGCKYCPDCYLKFQKIKHGIVDDYKTLQENIIKGAVEDCSLEILKAIEKIRIELSKDSDKQV